MQPERVLILRALGLGDFLTGVPALRGVRERFPDCEVTLAAPQWLQPLVPLACAADRMIFVDRLGELPRSVTVPYDIAINLHGRGPQSIDDVRAIGASTVITHQHDDHPDLGGPRWRADLHEIERWCRLIDDASRTVDRSALALSRPAVPSVAPCAVVIHPGAAAPARRWPAERFAAVAHHLRSDGHDVVITGDAAEAALAQIVASLAMLPGSAVLAGKLAIDELASLISAASLLICGDTGVAHLASAYAVPSVLLFGPTSPDIWGPPPSGPHTTLWAGTTGDPHAPVPDSGLLQITVEDVLAAATNRIRKADR